MSRPAKNPCALPLLSGVLALLLMLAGCGGGGGGSTAGPPSPGVSISPPLNVTATGANGSVTVSWTPPATGAASYNLYWSNSPEITKTTGNRITNVTSQYLHGGLPIDEDFYYVVCSVHATGAESAESAVAFAWSAAVHTPGPDVGQYFDRGIQAAGAQNYDDRSSHPLRGLTTPDNTLRFGGRNCLACHNASGPARTSDECLMCHFENQPNSPINHKNGIIELAAITGNGLPTVPFPINTIRDYDDWCLQCHASSTVSLGGVFPSTARRTVIDPAAFANSRHRAQTPPVGCIYCHHPHGRSNTMLVRENPANRGSAPGTPTRFGVFPGDTTGSYTGSFIAFPNENRPYRARVDNTAPDVSADADDELGFCNKACHLAKIAGSLSKDKILKRDATTGLYTLTTTNLKIYTINGQDYTKDNVANFSGFHVHVSNGIISTDDMVTWFADPSRGNLSGPNRYKYPGTGTSDPAAFNNVTSPLPFFPDVPDGVRDFPIGYLNQGWIKYRFTCSTCHDPHGTTSQNFPGNSWYPDLRLPKTNPSTLCLQCHR